MTPAEAVLFLLLLNGLGDRDYRVRDAAEFELVSKIIQPGGQLWWLAAKAQSVNNSDHEIRRRCRHAVERYYSVIDGPMPWLDMLPEGLTRQTALEKYLPMAREVVTGGEGWPDYRFATYLYVRDLLDDGVDREQVKKLLGKMVEAEQVYRQKNRWGNVMGVFSSIKGFLFGSSTIDRLYSDLRKAMVAKDQPKVDQVAQAIIAELGDRAGVPENATVYQLAVPRPAVQPGQIASGFEVYRNWLNTSAAWWRSAPGPASANPMREPASAIEGCLAAIRAGAKNSDDLLHLAREAGDYLLFAQEDGRADVYPYPSRSGWITYNESGNLFYDNGLAGSAMFSLYWTTGEIKYKNSAIRAANWDITQPCVTNWNYNSFSVFLLSNAYRITWNRTYLEAAKEKARLGVCPGQLLSGPNKGRWLDPHNAEFVYHYILLRGLGALVSVLAENDPDLPGLRDRLILGLSVRNQEIVQNGIAHPETVLEVLSRLHTTCSPDRLPADKNALGIVGQEAAYRVLAQGQRPVAPNAWGLHLEFLKREFGQAG
jgi:hypothetical protein